MSAPPLETIRHSCAHVLAAAVAGLRPGAQFGVGPATTTGFFYDILTPEPLGQDDLALLAAAMEEIRDRALPFVREELSIGDAVERFRRADQPFKVELLELLRDRGSTAVAAETGDANVAPDDEAGNGDRHGGHAAVSRVSVYRVGGFEDLCRGPHVASSDQIGHFALVSVTGAYWRGDESRPQLQRIHGLCFATAAELEAEQARLVEVRRRDHRRLGAELDIFALSPAVGAGLPLWLPNGTAVRDELEHLAREKERAGGYQRVVTPHITSEELYHRSGHLPYYADDMYAPMAIAGRNYYLRPMNCPHHHQVYLSRPRSYRDLPLRLAEYGDVHRYEDSGALSGLFRVRGFSQNDAHIYCAADDALAEFLSVMELHAELYRLLDIEEFHMRLSLPDLDDLDKYVDDPDGWRAALDILHRAMESSGLPYVEAEGEAAFYGPKVDFIVSSVVGVEYAISTNQLDFVSTSRFGLTYTGPDGGDHPVYVIHRAPLGSHERFVGFLLEHHAGAFPLWLAPVQARVIPISDEQAGYATEVVARLRAPRVHNGSAGLRVDADLADDRMQKKVRRAALEKIPLQLVVGRREAEAGTVSVRDRDGTDHGPVDVGLLVELLVAASEARSDRLTLPV